MKHINVVIGSNFGDEGKGLMTDYLSAIHPDGLVIRFNGGCQAGHTVTTPSGKRHVFGHFGSGSFLNLPTYLSSFFVVNPMLFYKELNELNSLGIFPKVYVDENCIVTTPFDILLNQIVETVRGDARHGSCGLGFNETITRCLLNKEYKITVKDLFDKKNVFQKLIAIQKTYLPNRLKELGITSIPEKYRDLLVVNEIIDHYSDDIYNMLNSITVTNIMILSSFDSLIFEGAQGLLLDQNHPYFPFVTRSNTGIKNVTDILRGAGLQNESINIIYVTRAYMTRHGAGPFPTELPQKPYEKIIDMTNIPNPFQGTLRFGLLDLNALSRTIQDDLKYAEGFNCRVQLSLSCLDQLDDEVEYFTHFEIKKALVGTFIKEVFTQTNINSGYLSYGVTRKTIKRF